MNFPPHVVARGKDRNLVTPHVRMLRVRVLSRAVMSISTCPTFLVRGTWAASVSPGADWSKHRGMGPQGGTFDWFEAWPRIRTLWLLRVQVSGSHSMFPPASSIALGAEVTQSCSTCTCAVNGPQRSLEYKRPRNHAESPSINLSRKPSFFR